MKNLPPSFRHFAVHGVAWRHYLDWALANVPFYLQPVLLFVMTIFFFLFAAANRRAVVANLACVLPGSWQITNHFRAFRTFLHFGWTIAEAANYRINKADMSYEIVGAEFLAQLAAAEGAIVLTAHMGNYDLGANLFAQKLKREIRMVRAPEVDRSSEHHLRESVQETGRGAVKIDYNTAGPLLSFDLLSAVRSGAIVSIQGDRTSPGVARIAGRMFGEEVVIPSGPFTLALVAEAPIFPLFIVRAGFRRYRIVVCEPIAVARTDRPRNEAIAAAVTNWCAVLETMISRHRDQWFAFAPIFALHARP